MDFDLTDIVIKVACLDSVALRRQFPVSGREFAASCRSTVCDTPFQDCSRCFEQSQCEWHYVFSQSFSDNPLVQKRYQKPPLPFSFAFSWPDTQLQHSREKFVEFRLVLLGRAITSLAMLLEGFRLLLDNGMFEGCRVESAGSRDLQGNIRWFSRNNGGDCIGELSLLSSGWIMESEPDSSRVDIELISPLRLLNNGKPVYEFSFRQFARTVMRKVSALAYYYGDYEFDIDFAGVSQQMEEISINEECFSYRNDGKLSGVFGSGIYDGVSGGMMPFLRLGSYFNVGKLSAFGMGQYRVL
jgi:hypothetical protein